MRRRVVKTRTSRYIALPTAIAEHLPGDVELEIMELNLEEKFAVLKLSWNSE